MATHVLSPLSARLCVPLTSFPLIAPCEYALKECRAFGMFAVETGTTEEREEREFERFQYDEETREEE